VEDTELVDGLVFDRGAVSSAGGPTRIKDARIGFIQYQLTAPRTYISTSENNIFVEDYQQIDRILKQERSYILKLLKPIFAAKCNVLLIQKSILREAFDNLSLHYLAKKKIMVIPDVERDEIDYVSMTLGVIPVADSDTFTVAKLGYAEIAEEVHTPGGKLVKITGVKNPGKSVSIVVRGSNRMVLDEAERSVHDALCVVRALIKQKFMVPGGGAPETEVALQLATYADTVGGMASYCIKAFARALEIIPYTLAENAGLHAVQIVTELRRRHAAGEKSAGINIRKGEVSDMLEENVIQPLLVSQSCMKLAAECVRTILKIDEIVAVRGRFR